MRKPNARTPEAIRADRDRILSHVAKHPDRTSAEIAKDLGTERTFVQRDLSFLVEKGLVASGGLRYWVRVHQQGCALSDILTPKPPQGDFPSRQVRFDNDWKPHKDRSRRLQKHGLVSSLNTIHL